MKTEEYGRAKAIFLSVADTPPSRWEAVVRKRCGSDTALFQTVHRLLLQHERRGGLLNPPIPVNSNP